MSTTLFDIPVSRLDGTPDSLAPYRGSVVLVVNVASACGLTPQYESLERAYETYRDRGFVVLGFPSNQFGAQEPGTSDEIAAFCSSKYNVQFPLFEKIDVNGPARHPIYTTLVEEQPEAAESDDTFRKKLEGYGVKRAQPDDVLWNFEKFLISRDGRVVGRFAPAVTVDDSLLRDAIERELDALPTV
ncbi:MAG: glutathione peroxidase [Candidatus Eremiobacteraeota bacterium]|nr:glutathione peroxidase [Candidatus Eremiobacteraeota bacterium]